MIGVLVNLIASSALAGDCTHEITAFHCVEYVKNYDGDTVTFNIPKVHPLLGKGISVRILGLDTPERHTKNVCERRASAKAQKIVHDVLVSAKQIDLVNISRDKYFRIDADIIADGKNVKDIIMKANLAVPYDGGKKAKVDWCPIANQEIK